MTCCENAELLNRETWVGAMFPLNNPKGKRKRKKKWDSRRDLWKDCALTRLASYKQKEKHWIILQSKKEKHWRKKKIKFIIYF